MIPQIYRFYKRVRAKRDAAEVGPKGPDMVDELQGKAGESWRLREERPRRPRQACPWGHMFEYLAHAGMWERAPLRLL